MQLSAEWMGLPWVALAPLVLGLGWISQELSRSIAEAVGLLDHPNARKIHARPVPLSGGPGIFGPLALGYLIWLMAGSPGMATSAALALGLGFAAIFMTGLIDDLRGISARKRLLIQAGVATLLWGAGFRIDDIAFGSWTLELSVVSLPLTLFWFMGFMNTSNLMDGMDGLSGGMNLIALLALGTMSLFITPVLAPVFGALCLLLAVFLVFNLRSQGKVFLGDSGSTPLGLTVGCLALFPSQSASEMAPSALLPGIALAAYSVGIADVLTTISRRMRRGVSPLAPDQHHLHHRLLRAGLQVWEVRLLLLSASLLACLLVAGPLLHRGWLYSLLGVPITAVLLIGTPLFRQRSTVRDPQPLPTVAAWQIHEEQPVYAAQIVPLHKPEAEERAQAGVPG